MEGGLSSHDNGADRSGVEYRQAQQAWPGQKRAKSAAFWWERAVRIEPMSMEPVAQA
jgi:hypothetical protein